MQRVRRTKRIRIVGAIILLLAVVADFVPIQAQAGFIQAYLRLDRMKINTASGGLVCARASLAGPTEAKVIVTFPSTYTLNTTAANWVMTTTNLPSGATAWPGVVSGTTTASAVDNTLKTATFPSNDLPNNTTLYCFNFAAASTLTTAAAAANSQQASIQTQTSANAVIDLTQIALANATDDTILVTAVVPPSFIFTMSGYADPFASNLDPLAVVNTSGIMVDVVTNAKGGWIAWARSQYAGLYSATAGYTIPTVGTINGAVSNLTAGNEGYVMDVDLTADAASGCTVNIDNEYDGSTATEGGTLSTSYQPLAECTGTSPATANHDQFTLTERAAISGATPASSDYTDNITVVGAGNF